MLCPCKSKKLFIDCCQPLLNKKSLANTVEQLMRSRYSAFASNNAQYIIDTYSKPNRQTIKLNELAQQMKTSQWRNLIIHHNEQNASTGIVEFSAFYIEHKQLFVMHEKSFFIKEDEQWFYHDGEMIEHYAFNQIKRNVPCPCQQLKKFKQCCALYLN